MPLVSPAQIKHSKDTELALTMLGAAKVQVESHFRSFIAAAVGLSSAIVTTKHLPAGGGLHVDYAGLEIRITCSLGTLGPLDYQGILRAAVKQDSTSSESWPARKLLSFSTQGIVTGLHLRPGAPNFDLSDSDQAAEVFLSLVLDSARAEAEANSSALRM
jgi:hypothetical protein